MRIRIGTKMALAVVFFAGVGIVITATFAFNFYKEAIIEEMIAYGGTLSELIDNSMHKDMMLYRPDNIQTTIRSIGEQNEVSLVRLYNKQGTIRYSSIPSEIGQQKVISDHVCIACHVGEVKSNVKLSESRIFRDESGISYLSLLKSIRNEKGCWTAECHHHSSTPKVLGLLNVMMPLYSIEERIQQGRLRTALFALVAMAAFSIITLMIVRQLILHPVEKLVVATGQLSLSEWSDPISGGRQDELGDLIRAFNRMQERLQVSQRQLVLSGKLASVGKLAAGVAHEINNPLTGILTFAEDLYDSSEADDGRREDYQLIIRETIRCRDIVRELLDFARQHKPKTEALDLNDTLKRTIKLVSRLAQFQNCRIITEFQPNLPLVMGDIGQLQQVYLNMLVNAAESMPNGGDIRIVTRHDSGGPLLETEVSDTGAGMTDAQRQRIFEPFFSTKEGKSHGLGLSVSWGIIEEHGGTIDVKSSPDEGTVFYVSLPVYRQNKKSVKST